MMAAALSLTTLSIEMQLEMERPGLKLTQQPHILDLIQTWTSLNALSSLRTPLLEVLSDSK
jgi:hypothetical protein